jgi:hypothetical protein
MNGHVIAPHMLKSTEPIPLKSKALDKSSIKVKREEGNLMSRYYKPLNDSYSVVSPVESGESDNDGIASDIADEMDFSS